MILALVTMSVDVLHLHFQTRLLDTDTRDEKIRIVEQQARFISEM